MYHLAVNSLMFAAGFLASRQQPNISRTFVCFSVMFSVLGIVVLAITGALHEREGFGEAHRWIGHTFTIVNWSLAIFSAGVVLGDRHALGCLHRGLALGAVAASLIVTLNASFTGYLYPHDDPIFHEETANRFYVLHCLVVPSVLFGLHLFWIAALRPRRATDPANFA